jgi:adenosylcobinamide-GDP ribazoletransferase
VSISQRDNGMRQLLNAMRTPAPTKFAPLVGLFIGAVGGTAYWLAAQLWPTSIALVLAMLASAVLTNEMRDASGMSRWDVLRQVFYLLLKYNVLMALSAAKLPFAAPANMALPLIVVCAYGASRALFVSMVASLPHKAAPRISNRDLAWALAIGLAPSVLLGIPGLVGLAVAIVSSLGVGSYLKTMHGLHRRGALMAGPVLGELAFYLGAQASWSYVS